MIPAKGIFTLDSLHKFSSEKHTREGHYTQATDLFARNQFYNRVQLNPIWFLTKCIHVVI